MKTQFHQTTNLEKKEMNFNVSLLIEEKSTNPEDKFWMDVGNRLSDLNKVKVH